MDGIRKEKVISIHNTDLQTRTKIKFFIVTKEIRNLLTDIKVIPNFNLDGDNRLFLYSLKGIQISQSWEKASKDKDIEFKKHSNSRNFPGESEDRDTKETYRRC